MSEYLHVEKPFLDQLASPGWTVIDQGHGFIPSDPAISLRASFREWMLPDVCRAAVRSLNRTADGKEWQWGSGAWHTNLINLGFWCERWTGRALLMRNILRLLRRPALEAGAYSHIKQPLFDLVKVGFGNTTGI